MRGILVREWNLTGHICSKHILFVCFFSPRLVLNYENVLNFRSLQLMWVFRRFVGIRHCRSILHSDTVYTKFSKSNVFYLVTSSFSMSKIFFPVSARNWMVMEHVELIYDGQSALFNGSRGINTPAEYSFHCQSVSNTKDPLLVSNSSTDNATLWNVLFTDFQVPSHTSTKDIRNLWESFGISVMLPAELHRRYTTAWLVIQSWCLAQGSTNASWWFEPNMIPFLSLFRPTSRALC